MSDVQTAISPPETDEGDDGDSISMRISASIIDVDAISYDAAVQIFDEDCKNPDMVATALVRIVMALGLLYGPDVSWAVQQRVAPPATDEAPRPVADLSRDDRTDRITTAIANTCDCADITVTVREADGSEAPLRRLARCLDGAGLIDWDGVSE